MKNDPAISSTSIPIFEDIQTPRLDLIAVTPESLHIQKNNNTNMRAELGAAIGARIPNEWPHEHWEPHVLDYLLNLFGESAEAIGWCRYLALRNADGRILIGTVGSGFPKPETGEAEIGYGILPNWQRQGYAPEAVAAMLPWLASRREIRAFVAQTIPASARLDSCAGEERLRARRRGFRRGYNPFPQNVRPSRVWPAPLHPTPPARTMMFELITYEGPLMPLSGEAIRLMNYIDDVSVTLRRILTGVATLDDEERALVLRASCSAKPSAQDVLDALSKK